MPHQEHEALTGEGSGALAPVTRRYQRAFLFFVTRADAISPPVELKACRRESCIHTSRPLLQLYGSDRGFLFDCRPPGYRHRDDPPLANLDPVRQMCGGTPCSEWPALHHLRRGDRAASHARSPENSSRGRRIGRPQACRCSEGAALISPRA